MTVPARSIIPSGATEVVISVNPHSGSTNRRELVDQLAEILRDSEMTVHVLQDVEEVKDLAERLMLQDKLRCVVAAGGDGTVALLANMLPKVVPIAILPLGTENLLAKHFGLKAESRWLAELILAGQTTTMDVGLANGKLFLVMASCGFDAEVVRKLHSARKGHIKHSSYIRPILSTIWNYKYPEIRVTVEGDESSAGSWAFIFNVPRYAMNLAFAPNADPHDGKLDVCTFLKGGLFRGLLYLGRVVRGKHLDLAGSELRSGPKMRIESDQEVSYQLDGDPGGYLPLEIETLPGRLRLVVE